MSRIRNKLILTYFIVLLVTFFTTIITFNYLSKRYLIRNIKEQLRAEGQIIQNMIVTNTNKNMEVQNRIWVKSEIYIASISIESEFIVVSKTDKVVFKNLKALESGELIRLLKEKKYEVEGYITEVVPVLNDNNDVKGHIFLLAKAKAINELNGIMTKTQLVSFTIAAALALMVGIIYSESITKSLKRLMDKMENFSINNTYDYSQIQTGDEIQELDKSFGEMVMKIHNYDQQQKNFFQNTSHELKSPLMSIQGYAEAIKDGIVEGKELERSLDIIIDESQRLKKTVNDIIYLTKLENSSEKLNCTIINLCELIEKLIGIFKPLAINENIKIFFDNSSRTCINADSEKLYQALINIMSNCLRYADSFIELSIVEKAKVVELKIIDDGEGFKPGENKKIFDRFYKGKKGNTGIGLAITKVVVEAHGGEIIAYNNNPKGAVFKVTLLK